jgi:hypothetical protein
MQDAWARWKVFAGLPATTLLPDGDVIVVYYSGRQTDETAIHWLRLVPKREAALRLMHISDVIQIGIVGLGNRATPGCLCWNSSSMPGCGVCDQRVPALEDIQSAYKERGFKGDLDYDEMCQHPDSMLSCPRRRHDSGRSCGAGIRGG